MEIAFYQEGDSTRHTLESDTIVVLVKSLLPKDKASLDINDIAPPATFPFGWKNVLIVVGCVAAAAAAFLILWKRRRIREKIVPPLSAHEIAYRKLEALLARELVEEKLYREFTAEVADILREYIEDRFALKAPERTTEEFLVEVSPALPVDAREEGHSQEVPRSLRSREVRGARAVVEDVERTFATCRDFIEATKAREEVKAEAGGGARGQRRVTGLEAARYVSRHQIRDPVGLHGAPRHPGRRPLPLAVREARHRALLHDREREARRRLVPHDIRHAAARAPHSRARPHRRRARAAAAGAREGQGRDEGHRDRDGPRPLGEHGHRDGFPRAALRPARRREEGVLRVHHGERQDAQGAPERPRRDGRVRPLRRHDGAAHARARGAHALPREHQGRHAAERGRHLDRGRDRARRGAAPHRRGGALAPRAGVGRARNTRSRARS